MNDVKLIGNLGLDVELKKAGENSITNLRIATSFGKGEQQKTEWHDVVLFGKTAELAAEHLTKGSKVLLQGRIQTRKWQDKDGNDRYTTEVVGQEMKFLPAGGGSVNRAILEGNLGADPEGSATQSGTAVANFRIATTTHKGGKEHTEWHRVVAFGKTAETVTEYLKKGSRIYLEGRLQTRSYEVEGQTKYTTEMVMDNMTMLGGGSKPE